MSQVCCNQDCNQGRDCPLRKVELVAWRNLCVSNIGEDSEWIYNEIGQGEPLYTHPVQKPMMVLDGNRVYPAFKELTDEEICKIFNEHTGLGIHQKEADKADLIVFARAIMKRCGIISGTDK